MGYGETIQVQGEVVSEEEYLGHSPSTITQLVQNPKGMIAGLNLTEPQSLNVRSLVTGLGAAASEKYLSRSIGPLLAGALGGLAGAWIGKKLFG